MTSHYEIALIGAGPIGIECAVALKAQGANYIHLERGQIGATIEWYAPGTTFFSSADRISIAGVPLFTATQGKANREEYLMYLRAVVTQFNLPIETFAEVTAIHKADDQYAVSYSQSSQQKEITAKKLILAFGDMHLPRVVGVPGEDLPHVSHYLADPHHYFKKRVLIVGGKNSAVEAAIRLQRVGAEVSISYRGKAFDEKRVKYWLYPELLFLIRKGRIAFYPSTTLKAITQETVTLSGKNGERTLAADMVLLLTGYVQEKTLFSALEMPLKGEEQKPILHPETMESKVPGVYVIGTAMAGTQTGGVKEFIETAHEHVQKVIRDLYGSEVNPAPDAPAVDREFLEN